MSFPNGSEIYGSPPSSMAYGGHPDEPAAKRQKMSPPAPPTFKTPQAPLHRKVAGQQQSKDGEKQERTDINDLGDLLVSSGIDEKREEEFLSNSYHRNRGQSQTSQAQPQIDRYGNQHSKSQPQPSSFDLLSQNFSSIGQRPDQLDISVKSEEDIARERERKHRDAVREYNTRLQHHLEDPFLFGNNMRLRIQTIGSEHGVNMPMNGLFDRINNAKSENPNNAKTPVEETKESVQENAPSILNRGSPLDGILCVLSLAAHERIGGLLEDSFALARGRQVSSDGVVPEEFNDWVVPPEDTTDPQQQSLPNDDNSHQPKAFERSSTDDIAKDLSGFAQIDRQREERRRKRRADRRSLKENGHASATNPVINGESQPQPDSNGIAPPIPGSTSGPAGLVAPEPPKLTKKERERLAKQDVSEEVQLNNTNSAISMALGAKRKYSWLNGGKKGSATNTPKLGTSRSATPGAGVSTPGSNATAAGTEKRVKNGDPSEKQDRTWGAWREDGPSGKGVQLRDWINILDWDRRALKTLYFAIGKLGHEQLLDNK